MLPARDARPAPRRLGQRGASTSLEPRRRQRRLLCCPFPRQNSSGPPYLVSARDGHDGSPSWLCFVESQPLVCGILSRRPNLPEREQRRRLLLNRSLDVVEGERYLSNAQRGTGACSASPALRPRLAPAATYQVRGTAGSLRERVCLAEMACQVSFRARGVGAADSPRRVAEMAGVARNLSAPPNRDPVTTCQRTLTQGASLFGRNGGAGWVKGWRSLFANRSCKPAR